VSVAWTSAAKQDRDDIWFYVSAEHLSAAARMDELFSAAAARLGDHLNLAHPGKM